MRTVNTESICDAVERMCMEASYEIPGEIVRCYYDAREDEESELGKQVLDQIIENSEYACTNRIPSCQDTGMVVVFMEVGRNVTLVGKPLEDMINEGVTRGYKKGYLRKSVVAHPIDRVNTSSNAPAVIYYEITEGDSVDVTIMPKGFGSENMSALVMLKPSDGLEGVLDFVVRTVENAGANACPPLFIGVGLGGTADKAMLLSKKALLRTPGIRSTNETDAGIERKLMKLLNDTGIGPAGTGGTVTVFDVFVESYPTHIAGLPVAVNVCCHALRHRRTRI